MREGGKETIQRACRKEGAREHEISENRMYPENGSH